MLGCIRQRRRTGGLLAYPASLLLTAVGFAQTPPDPGAQAPTNAPIPVEVFRAPHPQRISMPSCDNSMGVRDGSGACAALLRGTEGWVELGFMVDPQGKPFEITVIRSTGNKVFDDTAAKAITQSTFEPGSLDGKPIESGFEMKYLFRNQGRGASSGASPAFVRNYKALVSAINSDDRAAADSAMGKLQIGNLYEDSYFGLATFSYARKWGDESQQLEGLRRAIAEEDVAHYLPKDLFQFALLGRLKLEFQTHEYAEVMTTWRRLEKLGVDKETQLRVQPVMDQLQKIRSDDSSYEVDGRMPEGAWFLHLFKRHFQAVVSEGLIEQVKLRCDKRYVYFSFDPKLQYEVANADGKCSVQLVGAPGTKFKFIQF